MPDAPATIVRMKSSWPGNVDYPGDPPVTQVQRREVELDRDLSRRSSTSRSMATPVRAATRADFP